MLKSHCNNDNEKKTLKKMQILGREPTSIGLIGHRRNHYATETDAIYPMNMYIRKS